MEERFEDELQTLGERVGAEDAVLAAVAGVTAERRRTRDRHAVGGDEGHTPGAAAREIGRLALKVRDPAPGRLAAERAGAADDRTGELPERPSQARAPAPARDRVRIEEDHDVACGLVPAPVAGGAREASA